jgi:Ca2+-binding EF-hand superfamily protein
MDLPKNTNNLRISTVLSQNFMTLPRTLVSEKELQKLYKNFSKIDKDKSGMLEPEEFFDIPGKFKVSSKLNRTCAKPSGP